MGKVDLVSLCVRYSGTFHRWQWQHRPPAARSLIVLSFSGATLFTFLTCASGVVNYACSSFVLFVHLILKFWMESWIEHLFSNRTCPQYRVWGGEAHVTIYKELKSATVENLQNSNVRGYFTVYFLISRFWNVLYLIRCCDECKRVICACNLA